MKLIVGLGNPGEKYETTRHNVGAQVVQLFAVECLIGLKEKKFSSLMGKGHFEGQEFLLIFPQTFMNRSGDAVAAVLNFYQIRPEEMLMVHDDIDLDLGRLKLDFNVGAAGHRGVSSVIESIGMKNFSRLRIGVGRPQTKEEVELYVLSPFSDEEKEKADVMREEGVKVIKKWLQGG
ncbi:MAG: aminoacyl-tRNA hydrolase [Deltaproteobacteria bacterium]|nr:aminoacyl-tRNA hydrolase [Deltaproteobacteria bacterium]